MRRIEDKMAPSPRSDAAAEWVDRMREDAVQAVIATPDTTHLHFQRGRLAAFDDMARHLRHTEEESK